MRVLMAARRTGGRTRTHLAKQALGERGPDWHTVVGRRRRIALLPRLLDELGLPHGPGVPHAGPGGVSPG